MMRSMLVVVVVIMLVWSIYDFLKLFFIKWKYRTENIKIIFSAPILYYLFILFGIALGVTCLGVACIFSKYNLIVAGVLCFSTTVGMICHCYYGITDSYIIMNGRKIFLEEVEKHSMVRDMAVLSFIKLFEVSTKQYREYVYVKRDFEIKNNIS